MVCFCHVAAIGIKGRQSSTLSHNSVILRCFIFFLIIGEEQAEVHLMSNMNGDTKIPMEYTEALQAWLRQLAEDVMNQQVVKTDMKLSHILNKGIEVNNIIKATVFCGHFLHV